ncbi:MAG: transporter substrate-binding domain-containing protein [Gammaproteobacteria bacterium]|nr:transporter substrate-binding domain-containing protein [Gammaproteobacteria bacterium]
MTPSEEVSRGFGDVEVELLDTRWTGDLDGMIERRVVRALVVPTQTHYFVHNGKAQGIAAEMLLAFEKFLNRNHAPEERHLRTHVVFVPTTRDDLIPALNEGRGDLAVAALTITPGRLARADFSEPFLADVDEIIVTGPAGPELERLEDLAGTEIHVRASSSYHEHLEALNERFREAGLEPIRLVKVPEVLQDADLMELVDAGVLGPIVVDDYKAELWAKVFPNLVLRHDLAVNTGGEFGWMMRKGSPKLKAQVDAFARRHRQGTLFGNTVLKRYTESTRYVRDAVSADARLRFDAVDELFRRYAERYGLDYLLTLAQGFQESRLDHEVRSPVGAIGIMQLMPTTAEAIGIEGVGDLEANIHAGIKYTRNLIDRYFDDPGIDRLNRELFALAAYNAGPTRIRRLRREAEAQGFDPDVWFDNVEVVAARSIGRETVDYVANIYKTYYAYRLLAKNEAERKRAREALDDRA